ncbi:MAG: hypothetical protein ACR2K6_11595 [Solirubrobacterales bacterium]
MAATLLMLALAPTAASADGLPVISLDTTRTGITSSDGMASYFAMPEEGSTDLIGVNGEGEGERLRQLQLRGTLAVPGIAWDGTTSGLSADGKTLVLIEPRRSFPRRETRFAVIGTSTDRLRKIKEIDLRGDYSFDAISPDGSIIYLIHYFNRRDPSRYEVISYETISGEMSKVLDSSVTEIAMRGFPQTRATGPSGRWEYTLYDGNRELPFVHALDTVEGTSVCVGLDHLAGKNMAGAAMELDPAGKISIANRRDKLVAEMDTSTWKVSDPRANAAVAAGGPPDDVGGGFTRGDWALATMLLVGLGGFVAFGLLRLSRRQRWEPELPDDPFAGAPGVEASHAAGADDAPEGATMDR